jgi:hypothetical protein
MRDLRQHARQEVSIETRLFLPCVNPKVIACRILDVSAGGAKIEMDIHYLLPPQLVLLRGEHENMYECQVAWQDGRKAGLKFLYLCPWPTHQAIMTDMKRARIIDKDHPSLS